LAESKSNSSESQSGDQTENQNLPEAGELESSEAKLLELEGLITEKDRELSLANARITELEQVVADRDNTIATVKQSITESEGRLATADNSLAQAVASYKALVITSNPAVPPDLVTGDTIETIKDSLEKAKALVGKVRQELEAEIALAKVPAGAPQRIPTDLSGLSPREKIQYAIGGKR